MNVQSLSQSCQSKYTRQIAIEFTDATVDGIPITLYITDHFTFILGVFYSCPFRSRSVTIKQTLLIGPVLFTINLHFLATNWHLWGAHWGYVYQEFVIV